MKAGKHRFDQRRTSAPRSSIAPDPTPPPPTIGRRARLRAGAAFTLGAWAIGQLAAPHPAQAQCSASANPAPPPPIQGNYADQSFSVTPPLTPYYILSTGTVGCRGQDGSYGVSGDPGSPGQAGAQIGSVNSRLTIIGGGPDLGGGTTIGANYASIGGGGGQGGQGGYDSAISGQGAVGGRGGDITVRFNGTFISSQGTPATDGLVAISRGGDGGRGGDSTYQGTYAKQAGNGGAGGAGGTVTVVADGAVQAADAGIRVLSLGGAGGRGGDAFTYFPGDTTLGGNGGAGGAGGTASLEWRGGPVAPLVTGLQVQARGGNAGDGGAADYNFYTTVGGDGGVGGRGGQSSFLLSGGTVTVNLAANQIFGSGVNVSANGGDGANGGRASPTISATGGSGGNGGAAGGAIATILGGVTYDGTNATGAVGGHGVLVQANGGSGGRGADTRALVGQSGGGGFAGAGGSARLVLGDAANTGTIRTIGPFAHGALVQSVGGAGGNGGNASFNTQGGGGAPGGDGGPVGVSAPNGAVVATGRSAVALLAQSVGGGGGSGGDTAGVAIGVGIAIGGNGGLGGNGGAVQLDFARGVAGNPRSGVFASTDALGGAGILAQSIGGSGGHGGSASIEGSAIVAMAIGGDAGGGGSGGAVTITNAALITSYGDHAAGVQAQSIGGGGGKGGAAFTFNVGVLPTAAIAIGGRGGGGGPAGNVSLTNSGQITTYGPDAPGVLLQSVGGGGGSGGAAAARAVDFSPSKEVPAVSVSVAMGGQGGAGNTAGAVTLNNSGLITTAGDGAFGVIAQSIGGGGGAGGDSTAASYARGGQGGLSISIAVAMGGSGGTGGTGGAVSITNTGLVATFGQDAYGVFAQSVGGGGGAGGGGDASAAADKAKGSFSTSVTVGGTGGTGGHAGLVSLFNSGAITTRGDGADGVFAQSVGGGGGAGGGGTATANGGNLAITVGVGGKGGAGGDGNTATVRNSGSIVTRGTDAVALSVQSVGGGGGRGGKAGATTGGVTDVSNATALFNTLSGGLGINAQVQNLGDGILRIGQLGEQINATLEQLERLFDQPQAGAATSGSSVDIKVSVTVGGSGGAAGNGGAVSATNTGSILTFGAQSDGIYAQSVGGGGGSGGGASSTSKANSDAPAQTAIGVGGNGGGGGSGGAVTVSNAGGGTIVTQGVAAFGIFAQSVGGGGGEGAAAGAISGSLKSLSIAVGGNGGGGGNGGAVSVSTGAGGSSITTTGKHGIAIVAQSVGGGGGLARSMTTDQTFDPAKIGNNPQGRTGDLHGLGLTLGGQGGASGDGSPVLVTTSGAITTSGLDAHGILAQSVGGGGGLVVGGRVNLAVDAVAAAGGGTGHGGSVAVSLQPGTRLLTGGDGAYGVLAQSVGGGGGIAGDLSAVNRYVRFTPNFIPANRGDGGAVTVAASGARIETTGRYAPAIFAQSIGGGGGLVNYSFSDGSLNNIHARGYADGGGVGGAVTVTLGNSLVSASGVGSAGILAQSEGRTSGQITVTLDVTSVVRGGATDSDFPSGRPVTERDVAAIRLLGGTGNRIDNAGVIGRVDSSGFAILADSPGSNTSVTNTGRIQGDLWFNDGTGSVDNQLGGLVSSPTAINLNGGTFLNAGALQVGGIGRVGETVLTGTFVQTGTGRLVVETNHAGGPSDLLNVQGSARLAGTVEVHPVLLANRSVTVLTARDGLTLDDGLATSRTPVFSYATRLSGNTLVVQPLADFGAARGLGANQRGVAAHLQRIWDTGSVFGSGFTALGGLNSDAAYGRALDRLSGQTVGAIAAFRSSSSHNFITNMLNDCATFEGAGVTLDEASCSWARVFGAAAEQGGTGGALGYRANTWNVQAGGQKQIAPGWHLGGTLAYESSSFRGEGGTSRVTGDSLLVGGILRYQAGPLQISGVLDAGHGWFRSRRSVEVGSFGAVASGSPNAWHVGAHARVAYQVPIGAWYVQPRLDLHLVHVRSSAYAESGAGPFNLQVDGGSGTTFAAVPAVEVGGRIRLGNEAVLRPFASAGILLGANRDWAASARFMGQAGPGFRATTPIPDVLGKFTLGAEILTSARWDVRAQYSAEMGDRYASHTGMARLAYRF